MSPEIATTAPWRDLFIAPYVKKHLVLVAVDEAHCIEEWLDPFYNLSWCADLVLTMLQGT